MGLFYLTQAPPESTTQKQEPEVTAKTRAQLSTSAITVEVTSERTTPLTDSAAKAANAISPASAQFAAEEAQLEDQTSASEPSNPYANEAMQNAISATIGSGQTLSPELVQAHNERKFNGYLEQASLSREKSEKFAASLSVNSAADEALEGTGEGNSEARSDSRTGSANNPYHELQQQSEATSPETLDEAQKRKVADYMSKTMRLQAADS